MAILVCLERLHPIDICRLRVPLPRGTAEAVSSPLKGLLVMEDLLGCEVLRPAALTDPLEKISTGGPDLSTIGRESVEGSLALHTFKSF